MSIKRVNLTAGSSAALRGEVIGAVRLPVALGTSHMKLFAALREDTQQGWVWLQDPSLPARSIVKIKNPENGKSVYCEALQIDRNFLAAYIQSRRISITNPQAALVISGWYRAALGGLSTWRWICRGGLTREQWRSLGRH